MHDLMFHLQLDFMARGFVGLFPENGELVSILSTHPDAPHLHICRNKAIMKQTVPVLLARNHGGGDAQRRLCNRFIEEAPGWFPMSQLYTVPTRSGEHWCTFLPFLFDRAPRDGGTFLGKVIEVCKRLDEERALSVWYFFGRIGMNIETPDGRIHRPEDYPDAPSGFNATESTQA